MIEIEEIKYRDSIIRPYILGRNWDSNEEFLLVQKVVKGERIGNYLKDYPFIYDYEWEVLPGLTNYGKGDLVFTDGKGNFLIVECKFIDLNDSGSTARTKRRKKRRHVEEQTPKYMMEFKSKHPNVKKVIGLGVTNEKIIPFK